MQEPVTLEGLERLKKAEPAIYRHIEEMFRGCQYTRREREAMRGLIDLGNFQLKAECNWYEYDLLRAPHEVAYWDGIIHRWDQIAPSERPTSSRQVAQEHLAELKSNVVRKETVVKDAKRKGHFWSIVPLLEFFDLPEEDREGRSCYPLLPSLMQKAYMRMQMPEQEERGSITRWLGSVKRLRFGLAVFGLGGQVEIERREPRNPNRQD